MASKLYSMTPKEIVAELDKYIIGQNDAKKSVAIALRNRYRRSLLDEKMREEMNEFFEQDEEYQTYENALKLMNLLEMQGYIKGVLWDENSEMFSFTYTAGALGGMSLKDWDPYMKGHLK